MRPISISLAFAVTLVLSSQMANADNPKLQCDPELFRETVGTSVDNQIKLTQLALIDKEKYEKIKKGVDTGGSITLKGVPISGYGSWDEFREARSRELSFFNYDYAQNYRLEYLRSSFQGPGAAAYAACVESKSKEIGGVHVWFEDVTASAATLVIRYVSSPPGVESRLDYVEFLGAANQSEKEDEFKSKDKSWTDGKRKAITLFRDPNKEMRVTIGIGSLEDHAFIPIEPIIEVPERTDVYTSEVHAIWKSGKLPVGTWDADYSLCPNGSFAFGFRQLVERPQADDPTGLNAIRLVCRPAVDASRSPSEQLEIRNREGPWGRWSGYITCPDDSLLAAYELSAVKYGGRPFMYNDVSAVDIKFRCRDYYSKQWTTGWISAGNSTYAPDITVNAQCPDRMFISGLKSQVEGYIGRGDDTALNDVSFTCRNQ